MIDSRCVDILSVSTVNFQFFVGISMDDLFHPVVIIIYNLSGNHFVFILLAYQTNQFSISTVLKIS